MDVVCRGLRSSLGAVSSIPHILKGSVAWERSLLLSPSPRPRVLMPHAPLQGGSSQDSRLWG